MNMSSLGLGLKKYLASKSNRCPSLFAPHFLKSLFSIRAEDTGFRFMNIASLGYWTSKIISPLLSEDLGTVLLKDFRRTLTSAHI